GGACAVRQDHRDRGARAGSTEATRTAEAGRQAGASRRGGGQAKADRGRERRRPSSADPRADCSTVLAADHQSLARVRPLGMYAAREKLPLTGWRTIRRSVNGMLLVGAELWRYERAGLAK